MIVLPIGPLKLPRFHVLEQKRTSGSFKRFGRWHDRYCDWYPSINSKDVKFKNLGLAILDEEHRFGVRQKEQMKALRAEVDVLTLTATPIPRTLSMAMEGLREFSVISTPPQKRLSIKTFHTDYSDGIIREAVMREFKRGGQVYFT